MGLADLLVVFFGALTGVSLGALGSGGSILALPAFVYAAGVPVKSAVATSLAVVGLTSLAGALMAARRCSRSGCPEQEVDVRVAVLFGLGGLAGSFGGARLAGHLSDAAQMALFAVVVLAAAGGMLRRRPNPAPDDRRGESAGRALWVMPALGAVVGALTGLVGVGGGFLIVPALALAGGVPIKRALATSLWIIAANSAMGVLGYVGRAPFALGVAAVFLAAGVAGMALGQRIARAARPRHLQTAFAVFLVLVGVFTAGQTVRSRARPAVSGSGAAVAAAPAAEAVKRPGPRQESPTRM